MADNKVKILDDPAADGVGEVDELEPQGEVVAAEVEKAEEKGYRGHKVDPEPNEKYTVKGVLGKL